jgi:sphinganine-1-phosphate aldolase
MVDNFIADLKDSIKESKVNPTGKGTMVAVYGVCFLLVSCSTFIVVGLGNSSPVGPAMVGQLATAFIDTLYKA